MGSISNTEVHNHHNDDDDDDHRHRVNFSIQRGFGTKLKEAMKETLFPDDPFRQFKNEEKPMGRVMKGVQYFIPIFEWLPTYNFRLFCSDLIAGLTISSLAIPQGISYAKLADLPPLIGLCKNHYLKSKLITPIFFFSFFFPLFIKFLTRLHVLHDCLHLISVLGYVFGIIFFI